MTLCVDDIVQVGDDVYKVKLITEFDDTLETTTTLLVALDESHVLYNTNELESMCKILERKNHPEFYI